MTFIPHFDRNMGDVSTHLVIRLGSRDIAIEAIKPPIECAIAYTGKLGDANVTTVVTK